MRFLSLLFFGFLVLCSSNSYADNGATADMGLWDKFKYNTSETWKNPTNYDLFVPVYTWHNRLLYDDVSKYNENPWGAGLGMSRYDQDGDWHSLFAMAFMDSNDYVQTIFGYAYQKHWYIDDAQNWYYGAGFVLTLTQRHEYSYIPVPLPLPAFSVGHKNVSLQMAYVPGVKNDGNVAFLWTKIEF